MDWENDILQRRQKAGKGNFADDSQSSTTIEAASFKKLAFKHDSLQKVAWLSICSSVCPSVSLFVVCPSASYYPFHVFLFIRLSVCPSARLSFICLALCSFCPYLYPLFVGLWSYLFCLSFVCVSVLLFAYRQSSHYSPLG